MIAKTIRYHKKRILSINEQGLHYLDEKGIQAFIDFKTCRSNWVTFVNSGRDLKGKSITENDTRCVGQRDIMGKPPYIEFFADPPIRFEFSEGLLDWFVHGGKLRDDFHKLQQAVSNAGWSTFDMS